MEKHPDLQLDFASPLPVYAQLVDQLRQQIARGVLPPGAPLPTVRQLAVELTINMHTVARAYNELAREGLITMRRGLGTHVQGPPPPPDPAQRARLLEEIAEEALGRAAAAGLAPEDLLSALQLYVKP